MLTTLTLLGLLTATPDTTCWTGAGPVLQKPLSPRTPESNGYPLMVPALSPEKQRALERTLHAAAPELDFTADAHGVASVTTRVMPCALKAELNATGQRSQKSSAAVDAFVTQLQTELGGAISGKLYVSAASVKQVSLAVVRDAQSKYGERVPAGLSDEALLAKWAEAGTQLEWLEVKHSEKIEAVTTNPCTGAQVPCDPPGPIVTHVTTRERVGARPLERRYVAAVVRGVVAICTPKGLEVRRLAMVEPDIEALRTQLFPDGRTPYESEIVPTGAKLRDAVTGEPVTDPVFGGFTQATQLMTSVPCWTLTPGFGGCWCQ